MAYNTFRVMFITIINVIGEIVWVLKVVHRFKITKRIINYNKKQTIEYYIQR